MKINELEALIDYSFFDQELIKTAIQHKSFNKNINNERLEFLGDAILNSVISDYLFEHFPNHQEGILTRARASLVNGSTLTNKAIEIKLDKCIKLSKGMINLGDDRKLSILEGAFEALIGAIFVDSGWKNVKKVIYKLYKDDLDNLSSINEFKDPKSILQEAMQANGMTPPDYNTVELKDDNFESSIELKGMKYNAIGKSKKSAEAQLAEDILKNGDFI